MAALHHNENSERLQAVTKEGKPCYSIRFPKHKKGEYSVRKEKTAATCGNYYDVKCMQSEVQEEKKHPSFFVAGYTKTLLNVLVREYEEDKTSLKILSRISGKTCLHHSQLPLRNPAKKQQLNSWSRDLHSNSKRI